MIKPNEKTCPNCGGTLIKRGAVKRKIITAFGNAKYITVKRYSCKDCKRWHRCIPDNIIPYKHYPKQIIFGFLDGRLNNEMLEFEDFPSDLTVNRWRKKYIHVYEGRTLRRKLNE